MRPASTLVELLVSVAIMAMLVGLSLSAVQKAREAANRLKCQNNLKQLALACHGYDCALGRLPDGGEQYWCSRSQGWSWAYQILPWIEQGNIYGNPNDGAVAATVVPLFVCPSRGAARIHSGRAMGDYAGNAGSSQIGGNGWGMLGNGNDGVIVRRPNGTSQRSGWVRVQDMTRGTSETLLLGEKCLNRGLLNRDQTDDDSGWVDGWDWDTVRWTWMPPSPDWNDPRPEAAHSGNAVLHGSFGGPHSACPVVMGDGSVRLISWQIDATVWRQMGQR